jgi:hypothetical protein
MPEPVVNINTFRVPLELWRKMDEKRQKDGYDSMTKWIRHLVEVEVGEAEPAGSAK